ncbi:hypothetical protein [uncultured Acinetobacter sp.]|nr:hypothetical protein [uncultured Acinetobacter sp.]
MNCTYIEVDVLYEKKWLTAHLSSSFSEQCSSPVDLENAQANKQKILIQ